MYRGGPLFRAAYLHLVCSCARSVVQTNNHLWLTRTPVREKSEHNCLFCLVPNLPRLPCKQRSRCLRVCRRVPQLTPPGYDTAEFECRPWNACATQVQGKERERGQKMEKQGIMGNVCKVTELVKQKHLMSSMGVKWLITNSKQHRSTFTPCSCANILQVLLSYGWRWLPQAKLLSLPTIVCLNTFSTCWV